MINNYYDENVEKEWNRVNDNYLEFETTYHHIISTIDKNNKILDLGSGPGRYSFRLAQDGYSVHLADLSEKNIEFAIKYADQNHISILGADVVDAKDLGKYESNSFDVILCLGPFYHFETEDERNRCVKELHRVVKNGGLIFCAFIMHYAPIYDFMKRIPETIGKNDKILLKWYETGYMEHEKNTNKFYISYFARQEEVEQQFTNNNFETEYVFGCEGILNLRWNQISKMDEEIRNKWLKFSYNFSKTNIGISNSEHIVYVGRKR